MKSSLAAIELLSPSSSLKIRSRNLNFFSSVSQIYSSKCSPKFGFRRGFNLNSEKPIGKVLSGTMSMSTTSSYKPEEARVPAAIPLPTPPITKASQHMPSTFLP